MSPCCRRARLEWGITITDPGVAAEWSRLSNDTIARICALFPQNFVGACQLPQISNGDLGPVIAELERCAAAGFVACNLNPDPSGGRWDSPPLTDPWWEPLWEALERLHDASDDPRLRLLQLPPCTPPARTTWLPTRSRSCSCCRATSSSGTPECA